MESADQMIDSQKVSIILVNWNGKKDTLACLESLSHLNYPDYSIIVVDNNSRDGSVTAIQDSFPQVTLLEMNENLGFVGGNNRGMTHAFKQGATYVLLLNNDTEVAPDFLDFMVAALTDIPNAGVAGPLIYYFTPPTVVWSAGGKIDWQRGATTMISINEDDNGQFGRSPYPVDFVTGCALLIKRQVIEEIGPLDSRFFAYYEETEWCVRAARAGFKILTVPQAKVWHKISPEQREASPIVHYYMTRNRLLFLELTHASWWAWLTTLSEFGRTLISWTIRPKWRHKASQRRIMTQAIADYYRRRFGRVDIPG
jgi:GT2 family glycosyltransferase